jgi:hypothetical protein
MSQGTAKNLSAEDLETIQLDHGSHSSPDEGHCLLEVVSMFAGEAFGDSPACVDPVLASFGTGWNDGMRTNEERAQLKQYIPRLIGTRKSDKLSQKRGWMAADWMIRVHTAAWLTLTPALAPYGESLKALPPITCEADLSRAMPALDTARDKAREARASAWDAARASAWDAAWDAARASAWDAARDAARDAAWASAGASAWDAARASAWASAGDAARASAGDAARASAWDAARASAWDAAWDAARASAWAAARAWLEPTVLTLQASAHDLFSRMIDAEA